MNANKFLIVAATVLTANFAVAQMAGTYFDSEGQVHYYVPADGSGINPESNPNTAEYVPATLPVFGSSVGTTEAVSRSIADVLTPVGATCQHRIPRLDNGTCPICIRIRKDSGCIDPPPQSAWLAMLKAGEDRGGRCPGVGNRCEPGKDGPGGRGGRGGDCPGVGNDCRGGDAGSKGSGGDGGRCGGAKNDCRGGRGGDLVASVGEKGDKSGAGDRGGSGNGGHGGRCDGVGNDCRGGNGGHGSGSGNGNGSGNGPKAATALVVLAPVADVATNDCCGSTCKCGPGCHCGPACPCRVPRGPRPLVIPRLEVI